MKIVFNHKLDWFWQIYDEWSRNNEIFIPDNFKINRESNLDLDALVKCINENDNIDFIFGFHGSLYDLIQWNKRNIRIPIIIFATNAINRPNGAKRSIYANIWYVEKYAKPLMQKFNKNNLIYGGMAANHYIYYPKQIEKKYDVGFFGQRYGERNYWLNTIIKHCKKLNYKYFFPTGHGAKLPWTFDDINNFYNQTKINLSFAPKSILGRIVNLRTFEINMSGNFQLMQYTPCVEEYFDSGKEIECWDNKKHLLEKITYYLENEDERKKIANNGYQRAISNHTWTVRLESIKAFLEKPKVDLTKFTLHREFFMEEKALDKYQRLDNLNSSQCYIELVIPVLKQKKYRIKSDIKQIQSINSKIFHKDQIDNKHTIDYFFEFFGKTIMVIRILASYSEINIDNWNDLEEIIYLTENQDLSFPQFGILTNGYEWVIRDFKNRYWLKHIPSRRELKRCLNIKKYFAKITIYYFIDFLSRFKMGFIRNIVRKIKVLTGNII